jgi:SAM-dependent methyltransferase
MHFIKRLIMSILPLDLRKQIAVWMNRQHWLPARDRWSIGIIRDLQASDPKAFHKFLWGNHISGYAQWYDSEDLFDSNKMNGSEHTCREFFKDLIAAIKDIGFNPASDIRSVLEVGCSLGYTLRFIEKDIFANSDELIGIDIDGSAIEKGIRYLTSTGSKVRLIRGDMEELDRSVGERTFDFVFATGVLSYLDETDATRVVSEMLRRTNKVMALVGLCSKFIDNRELRQSKMSIDHNNQWVHNFDALVKKAGGKVVRRRWQESGELNNQTTYFVFAVPG